ncbi:MAG: flavin reductase family protein [Firmicutes bacterium]|jgi:flavin reductase (DIM6/NTAB) family NADH-FMN oxidoreductase RutF|nr:flavin reductase family protein [Bacillota bacterium]
MSKIKAKPRNYLYPIPAVPVSCTDSEGRPNIITVAWTGVACGTPPMVSIAINLSRYSHDIIKETGAFFINIPDSETLRATDWCGNVSGRNVDKFKELGLTPIKGDETGCHYINECPINMECQVRHGIVLGSHELFIGEIVAVYARDGVLTPEGRVNLSNLDLFTYVGPDYYSIGRKLGQYGYSVSGRS